jgi:hypothetical protein
MNIFDAIGSLFTINLTEHRVWVTIYDLGQTQHLDYGYMEPASAGAVPSGWFPEGHAPFSARRWSSSTYFAPGVYHARGEVKDGNDNTIFDTRIEVTPATYVAYLTGSAAGYYWVQGLPPGV